jgi:hypothetical protein
MKKQLLLFFALSIFTFAKAQQTKTDSTLKQQNFSCGIKSNLFLSNASESYINGIDYSLYMQYKSLGAFVGYSTVYHFLNYVTYQPGKINCFQVGVIIRLVQLNKNSSINIYLYDSHFYQQTPNFVPQHYSNGTLVAATWYSESLDFITLSPRYKITFLKNIFAVEFGVFITAWRDNIETGRTPINGFDVTPAFGTNAALSINVAALFAKRH